MPASPTRSGWFHGVPARRACTPQAPWGVFAGHGQGAGPHTRVLESVLDMTGAFPPSPFGIARPAYKFIVPLKLLAFALLLGGWFAGGRVGLWVMVSAVVPGVLAGYVAWFFRDPHRRIAGGKGVVCCPADGKVASIIEVPCAEMPGGRARRVAVFLNIFNVHIQRTPVSGRVTKVTHKKGKFMNAMNEKCSEENENVTVWLASGDRVVGVRQITGAIARRIVCYVRKGAELRRGERYGLIQFGSRVEVFLPMDAKVRVKVGQKVSGGSTLLAVIPAIVEEDPVTAEPPRALSAGGRR